MSQQQQQQAESIIHLKPICFFNVFFLSVQKYFETFSDGCRLNTDATSDDAHAAAEEEVIEAAIEEKAFESNRAQTCDCLRLT